MWCATFSRTSSACSSICASSRKRWATEISASRGHAWNQSIVVQLVSAGNLRQRTRNALPTGEKQRTTWRFERTFSMKYSQQLSRESISPACFTSGRIVLMMLSLSSPLYSSGM